MNYVKLEFQKFIKMQREFRELLNQNEEKDKQICNLINEKYSHVLRKNLFNGTYHFKEQSKAELVEEFLQKIQKLYTEIETLKKRKWYHLLFNINP